MIRSVYITMILLIISKGIFAASFSDLEGVKLAVMDLKPINIKDHSAKVVSEAIRSAIVECWECSIIERERMYYVLEEAGFQLSDVCDHAECAIQVGKILAVEKMIYGTISNWGNRFGVVFYVVDVETGQYDKAFDIQEKNIERLRDSIKNDLCEKLASNF